MPFPRRMLRQDEQVLLDARPNWSRLVAPTLAALAVLAGLAAIFVVYASAPTFVGWILLGIVLLDAVVFGRSLLRWRTTTLTVTTKRVVYRTGVVSRMAREIPLSRVQDVTYRQSLLERVVGAGSLLVESAGEHGQEPFPDISRPARVQSLINAQLEQAGDCGVIADATARRALARVGAVAAAPISPVPDEIARLGELYRRGVLTQMEFETKKAELLRRM
jgi:membrane protein YdbS with pleckstrin-like domain